MSICDCCGKEINPGEEGKHIEHTMSPQEAFEHFLDLVGDMRSDVTDMLIDLEMRYSDIREYRDDVFAGKEKFNGEKLFLMMYPEEGEEGFEGEDEDD